MSTVTQNAFADRAFQDAGKNANAPPVALRALLKAHRLLGLAFGAEIAERRLAAEPLQRVYGEAKLNDVLLRGFREVAAILGEHLDKVHQFRRPHYSPELRFRILKLKSFLGLSQNETARLFRLASTTVARWEQEVAREPDKATIGSLVQPTPPIRRFADVVRRLVQSMASSGFGGNQRIAQTLARAGWKLSRETVRRIRQEKPFATTTAAATENASTPATCSESVTARRPNHVWMIDITEVPSWFRLFAFKLVVVLDVFSRYPLAWKTFWLEPSSHDIRRLLRRAIRRAGPPRHLVTDRGAQLTARSFRRWIGKQGIRQRFGALGKTGSIAIIERCWRTVKQLLGLPFARPLIKSELDRRLNAVFSYYAELKPHQGLGGNTPAERFFDCRPIALTDRSPPRARPGELAPPAPFWIRYFRGEPSLPYLAPVAE